MPKFEISHQFAQVQHLGQGLVVFVPFKGTIRLAPDDALGDLLERVTMKIDLVDGVLQPVLLELEPRPGLVISGTLLRQLPVRGMADHLIHFAIYEAESDSGEASRPVLSGDNFRVDQEVLERVRAQGPTEESLKLVAKLYAYGRVMGKAPAKYVETCLGMPRTTVTKWVRKARDLGMIAEEPNDGEYPEEA